MKKYFTISALLFTITLTWFSSTYATEPQVNICCKINKMELFYFSLQKTLAYKITFENTEALCQQYHNKDFYIDFKNALDLEDVTQSSSFGSVVLEAAEKSGYYVGQLARLAITADLKFCPLGFAEKKDLFGLSSTTHFIFGAKIKKE